MLVRGMKRLPFWLVLALSAVALAASAVLLVDYVRPAPVFCGLNGGCGVVKQTAFAYPLGIPTPAIGIAGILALALCAFVPGERARKAQAALAGIGGLVAISLLIVQASMKTICPYCAVVDTTMLLLAGLSIARLVKGWDPPERKAELGGAIGLLSVAIAVPLAIGFARNPFAEVPAPIVAEIQKTPRGKVTLVDFVDFECPFCRATHAKLAPLLAEHRDQVRVVRKNVPLRMHKHALDAARTACCAELMGHGDEMAEALMSTSPAELTPEGCERLAASHGLDVAKFRACVADPKTDDRIRADRQAFDDSKGEGLPTLWFNTQKLEGEQDEATLRSALDSALRTM